MGIINKIFGTYSDRELKKIYPIRDKVLELEEEYKALSDDELKAKTEEFKQRLAKEETLDDLLPEAFATVREASDRVLGMRHFPVQVIGGIVLHQGRIAEMKTGEGKTLVATLPAYLNALAGKGVHVVTVNDYLARRDSEWMGKLYAFLGMNTGLIVHGLTDVQKKEAYDADITYCTNNELGFDYLRDNMCIFKHQLMQRGHNFSIVDEVDSILIDEARTPLIISGQGDKSTELYSIANKFVLGLNKKVIKESDNKAEEDANEDADYIVDEKAKSAVLTAKGTAKAEKAFNIQNLSDPENTTIYHHVNQALKAHGTMYRDQNYVVKDGQVMIVDEFTGRIMNGRRYSDGLHQAIEAKEKVKVERESKTLATITFQNYFRLYAKLSGMTGTAVTEEAEFQGIYKLDVVVIPTNMPLARKDYEDAVFKNEKGKLNAIVEQVVKCNESGQPVLVGTVTIDKSELISGLLKKKGIKHEVLNAKFHQKEAEIIAQAGKLGAVTIATNMAGRGTDIMLGGNAEFMAKNEMKKQGFENRLIVQSTSHSVTEEEEVLNARKVFAELYEKFKKEVEPENKKVLEAGGLYIIGTERHESRRIDNQLRGRAGRQGDVGASKFFISLEDDLMRIFGSERIMGAVNAIGMSDSEPINAKLLSNSIEGAQKRIESRNYEMRKHVIKYDDVVNQQREIIYAQRRKVLDGEDLHSVFENYIKSVADDVASQIIAGEEYNDNWKWGEFDSLMQQYFAVKISGFSQHKKRETTEEELREGILDAAMQVFLGKEKGFGEDGVRELERIVLLQTVDQKWMDHIDAMEQLKQGIGLRGYAQRDPVVEYKFEGMNMFEEMVENIKTETVRMIMHAIPQNKLERKSTVGNIKEEFESSNEKKMKSMTSSHQGKAAKAEPVHVEKVGRNELCPCGSGKKYKKCCGANDSE